MNLQPVQSLSNEYDCLRSGSEFVGYISPYRDQHSEYMREWYHVLKRRAEYIYWSATSILSKKILSTQFSAARHS